MTAVRAVALAKTFRSPLRRRGQRALDGVDLEVARGTAFGLIGLNGAGKTTFIKLLLGVARPSSGHISLLGGSPEDPAARRRVGYLPERLHLPGSWTPVAFLRSVARLKRLTDFEPQVHRQLGRVGLAADGGRRIGGFSKGMRQRLGLAAALLGAPELLVLDEPTDGVDPLGRIEIRRLLSEERDRGATLFLNSHLLSETERICDRIGILAEGRLLREGHLGELAGAGDGWRARFEGEVDPGAMAAAGFRPGGSPGEWRCEAADAAALQLRLDAARGAGLHLVGLERDGRDLEAVLAEAVVRR